MLDYILGKDLAHYVKAHRGLLICSLVLTGLSTLFVVIPVYLIQPFIDEGMKSGIDPVTWKIPWVALHFEGGFSWNRTEVVLLDGVSPNRLVFVLASIAFLSMLIKSVIGYVSELASAAFSNRAIRSVRMDLFGKFVSLPLGFYHKEKAGELISRSTADLTVMQERISNILIGLIQYPLTAVVFLAFLLFSNYTLTLLVFLAFPLIVGPVRLFGRKVKKHASKIQENTSYVTAAYQETLLCLKVVQGFFMSETEAKRFQDLANRLYKSVMRWCRWNLGLGPILDSIAFLVLPGLFVVGKVYFHHSLGELLALMYAFQRLYAPVRNLAKMNNELRTLQGATERVFGIMRTTPSIRDDQGAIELPRHRQSIEFKEVSFSYEGGAAVLQEVSFSIRAGEMVAFVGSTGAGKSTLLELIPRFYDVTSGSITIDGTDVRRVTLGSLRRQISTVSQEVLLFHDTIANNIRYARPDAGLEEVMQAAKAAYAHDFILAQPQGYDSLVGDRGTLLSGGQRQRIAIARAILANPSILILDEAASALDAESEQLVEASIDALRGGRTILVAAHRLSTVRKADRIYVLEGGRIVESGRREDLLDLKGRFRQLHDIQFSA
ncbi:MAG: ABC transporter ATP-binding protein [Deltaproteobacteria bacterium]|nr:ABC transporter ATP-binding protein [Deltaproteobacteria bacterium]